MNPDFTLNEIELQKVRQAIIKTMAEYLQKLN